MNLLLAGPSDFSIEFRDNINPGVVRHVYHEIFASDGYAIRECRLESGSRVVDAGGWLGLFSIWAMFRGASKITVFEPNSIIVPFLRTNLANFTRERNLTTDIQIFQTALWSTDHLGKGNRLNFRKSGGSPGARLHKRDPRRGGSFVTATRLDSLNLGRVDFIKMDIEGSELQALKGAERTIKRYRPKLAISLYHRPQDRQEIPALIEGFGLKYDFRMSDKVVDRRNGFIYTNGFWW